MMSRIVLDRHSGIYLAVLILNQFSLRAYCSKKDNF